MYWSWRRRYDDMLESVTGGLQDQATCAVIGVGKKCGCFLYGEGKGEKGNVCYVAGITDSDAEKMNEAGFGW